MTSASRRGPRLADALVVVIALLLPLLALEAYLRLRGEDTRSWTRPDPILGWSYIPGAKYVHVSSEACPGWTSSGTINSHGLRDHELAAEKPAGTFRILALGDSFTEAFQFDLDRTWTKLLEARLNARGDGRHYEVINAGRSGMGTTLEWLYFANAGKAFGADLVLALFIPNDFQDNSKALALATAYGPYLVGTAADGWTVDTSFLQSRDYQMRVRMTSLKRASYVVSAGIDRYNAWRASKAARRAAAARGGNAATASTPGPSWTEEDFLWVEHPTPEWSESADVTKEALARLQHEAMAAGARFALVNGTSRIQVHPDAIARTRGAHPTWDLDRPTRILAATADSLGFAFHDLIPDFREAAAPGGIFLHGCAENHGEGHWSEQGNQIAAASLERFIVGLLDSAAVASSSVAP